MRRALACLVLLGLSGCCLPGLRGPDPQPVLPADFNGKTSEQNSAHVGVDEFFNEPILTQLIAQGLAQNQELKIRNEEVQIAANEVLARRGAYLPFLSGGFGGGVERTSKFTPLGAAEDQLTYPRGNGRNFPDPLPNTRLSADLTWRIDIWRQLRNARDAAQQRYCEAIEARNYLITRIVAEIAENYYELAALDKRLVFLDQTIQLQQESLDVATRQLAAGRETKLGVQRILAEVRKNESQRFIVRQSIIEAENRINFLAGRYPERVERESWDVIKLDSTVLNVGVPEQLLQNRRDVRAAEYELSAAGLDVLVARANFYPQLDITAGVGFEAFNPKYLFDPGAFIGHAAGGLVAPLVNRKAIRAEYQSANARQLQALYDYQRTVLNAFTEVVNGLAKVENYRQSVAIKQEQVKALEESVSVARDLFKAPIAEEFAKVEYLDILLATRDLLDARTVLIETKQQQLSAIVNTYRALGGGFLMDDSMAGYPGFIGPPVDVQNGGVAVPPPTGMGVPPAAMPVPPAAGEDNPPAIPDPKAPAEAPPAAAKAGKGTGGVTYASATTGPGTRLKPKSTSTAAGTRKSDTGTVTQVSHATSVQRAGSLGGQTKPAKATRAKN